MAVGSIAQESVFQVYKRKWKTGLNTNLSRKAANCDKSDNFRPGKDKGGEIIKNEDYSEKPNIVRHMLAADWTQYKYYLFWWKNFVDKSNLFIYQARV